MEHVFRGADMTLVQLYLARDIARSAVGALGELDCMHFRDLDEGTAPFQRQFVAEIRRVDEFLRAARVLEDITETPHRLDAGLMREALMSAADVQQVGEKLLSDSQRLQGVQRSLTELSDRLRLLTEEREVLMASDKFFRRRNVQGTPQRADTTRSDEDPLLQSDEEFDIEEEDFASDGGEPQTTAFGFGGSVIGGTVKSELGPVLERLCWRATRGNLYFMRERQSINEVFIVYTHGEESAKRVRRLAESLECRVLTVFGKQRLEVVNSQIEDLRAVLEESEHVFQVEQQAARAGLPSQLSVLTKERRIYSTLNLFSPDNQRQGLLAEAWVPTQRLPDVTETLRVLSQTTSQIAVVNTIKTQRTPPTFHTTNKVTQAFQIMVDVYGIAKHDEVNPMLPTVVTFPFMFAVMFGDIGHGFLMTLGALALVLRERKIAQMPERDELFDMAFSGRYVLLLMGLFSMYTGLLYNDIFSRSMTLFSSAFRWPERESDGVPLIAERVGSKVYPLGLDWIWHGAENNLRFTNSYKMKLSVLLGFVHMTYSLCFQLVNARHANSWVDVWGNFVPSMLFMQSIFGYLSLSIVYKWCVDWIGTNKQPPGLLDMLIKMFLSPGNIDTPLYKGQAFVQCVLLVLALVCVPWLLLFKPLYIRRQQKLGNAGFARLQLDEHTFAIDEDEGNELGVVDGDEEDGEDEHGGVDESFGDIMIHQVIHTIEFCLNCISHTASYLRLWALSLAHNQLSQVLWNMTLANAFGPTGKVGIAMVVLLFGMWFTITVMVLVCMEGTSAMLHALRLHWVEAMSKHFIGEGYAFTPLNLFDTNVDA